MHVELFEISERFRGPPRSGNGGYVCGRMARHLQGTVSVRLKAPPPLNTELRLESGDTEARLLQGAWQAPLCLLRTDASSRGPGLCGSKCR